MIDFTSVPIMKESIKESITLIKKKYLWFYVFFYILKLNATFKNSIDEPHSHYILNFRMPPQTLTNTFSTIFTNQLIRYALLEN